jgi:phosphoribosylaminoimidazole-succinocarboxamide synthase
VVADVGPEVAETLRRSSLAIYERGREIAEPRGFIVADTKFEFGRGDDGQIRVMDEMLTPDSSRFWPAESYRPGGPQPSFDKQPLRDYLEGLVRAGRWHRGPPGPDLPAEQVSAMSERYQEVFSRLTGVSLDEVPLSDWGHG